MLRFGSMLLAAMLAALPAVAEVSFVAEVQTEAEAENAAAARDMAMRQAQRDAFLQVAARLTSTQYVEELSKLTDDQAGHFIKSVSVISEGSSATTYHADLSVEINGALLEQYMQENNMLELPPEPAEILVIPVYSPSGYSDKILWEKANIWRQEWLNKGQIKSGVYEIKVIPDVKDFTQLLDVDSVGQINADLYKQIAERAKIPNVYTLHAIQAGNNTLAVIIRSLPDGDDQRIVVFDEEGRPFDKAVTETVAYLSEDMLKRGQNGAVNQQKIAAVYQYARLKDWLDAERRLKEIPQVKSLQTGAADRGKVQMDLEFSGSHDRFVSALEKAGFSVLIDNGVYILKQEDK